MESYFRPVGSKSVFAYNSTNNKWSELLGCLNSGCSLAMVNSLLTAIGGQTPNYELTNLLLSLTDNTEWTRQFPPMPTKCCVTVVSVQWQCSGCRTRINRIQQTEVMHTAYSGPHAASSLPHPLYQGSATLCGDQVYMLGVWGQNGQSKSVFTCSLAALLQICD